MEKIFFLLCFGFQATNIFSQITGPNPALSTVAPVFQDSTGGIRGNCNVYADLACGQTTLPLSMTGFQNNFTLAGDYFNCEPNLGYPMDGKDRVFRLRVPTAQNVHIVFMPEAGYDFDYFFLSSCNPLQCVAYSLVDNPSFVVYQEVIDVYLEANTDYFLVVDSKFNITGGTFRIGVNCNCTCTEASNDLPDGNKRYCDDFQDQMVNLSVEMQSSRWRLTAPLSDDAKVENFGGARCAHFRESGGRKPDLLYVTDNRTSGRYRSSWRMFLPTGKKGRFNVLHNNPDLNTGSGQNTAYSVFFDGNSTGRLVIPQQPVVTFTYPENTWFDVVNISDLDANAANAPRSANLYINHNFVQAWDFKKGNTQQNQLSAIQFQAIVGDDYYIDNICVWAKKTNCQPPTGNGPVCLKNGEQRISAGAARCDLFTSKEWGGCQSPCELGGTYIYRGDTYTGALEASDYPYFRDALDCGTPPSNAQVMDVYIFYKDDAQSLQVLFNNNGNNAVQYSMFACKVTRNNNCVRQRGSCLVDENGNVTGNDLPCNNFYYIVVYGPTGGTYTLSLLPNGPCEVNPSVITLTNCLANVSGSVSTAGSFGASDDAYAQCYNGNRTYAGGEKVYRFTMDRPADLNVTLSSSSKMGVFLYSFLCGRNCIGFAENNALQNNAVLDAHLAEGVYYLIVDKESGASDDFNLTLQCDPFSPFGTIQANNPAQVVCPLTPGEKHTVQLPASASQPALTVKDQIHFLYQDPNSNTFRGHDSLIFNWNGSTAMNFNLYKDQTGDPEKCSYLPNDTFVMFLAQNDFGKRTLQKLYSKYNTPSGNTFAVNGQSVINTISPVETVAFGSQTSELNLTSGTATNVVTLLFSTNLAWQVSEQPPVPWLSVSPTQSDGTEEVVLTIDPNPGELPRSTVLQFVSTQNAGLYRHSVLVRQRGRCNPNPALSITPPNPLVCGGSPVALSATVGTGLETLYQYRWSNNATTPNISVSPTSATTYTVTISNKYCDAAKTATATVSTSPQPAPPTNNTTPSICEGSPVPPLSVTVPSGHTVDWFASASGPQAPLVSGSTTYLPNVSAPGAYLYYAQTRNLSTGCVSATRTTVSLTIRPSPSLVLGTAVCAANFLTYSVPFVTNATQITPSAGTLSTSGGTQTVSGVPRGQNLVLTLTLGSCTVQSVVTDPCGCPSVPQPVSTGDKAICSNLPLPTLNVTVGTNETADWYDAAGVKLLAGSTSFLPNAAGTYYAEARHVPTGCVSASRTAVTLTIHPIPTLAVTDRICAPNFATYTVNASTTGTLTSSAGMVSGQNGNYTISNITVGQNVTLTASNANCSVQQLVQSPLCMCPPIAPPTSGGDQSICANQTIPALVAVVTTGQTVDWYDASGALLLTGNPVYTPNAAGTYFAEAREISSNCRSGSKTPITLTVKPLPSISVTAKDCAPDLNTYSVVFSSNGTPTVTVGNLSGSNGVYTINNIPKNTQTVIQSTLNACSAQLTVAALSCPCPSVNQPVSGGDKAACSGQSIPPLTVTVGPNETADWYNSAGAKVATGTLTYNATVAGEYAVEARNLVNNCVSAVRTRVVLTIHPQPVLVLSGTACAPNLATYSVSVSASVGATVTSSAGIVDGTAGAYTIRNIATNTNVVITATNAFNCSATLAVNAPSCVCPTLAPPVSGGDKTVCANQTPPALTVSVNPNETADWYTQSGTQVATGTLSFTPATPGTYLAETRNLVNNCRSSTKTPVTLTINPLPTLGIVSTACSPDLNSYAVNLNSNGSVTANVGSVTGNGNAYTISAIPQNTNVIITARISQTACSIQETVNAPPCLCPVVAAPIATSDQTICSGQNIPALVVTVGLNETANWYDDAGVRVASNRVSFTPSQAGVYWAEAQNTVNNCVSTVRTPIRLTIHPRPPLAVISKLCAPNLASYSVQVRTDTTATLQANLGTVANKGGGLFEVNAIPRGNRVTLTTTYPQTQCSTQVVEDSIACNCPPVAAPVAGASPTICEGAPIPTLSVTVGPNETANWYNAAGVLVAAASLSYRPTDAGNWFVETEHTISKCKSATKTPISLKINPKPTLLLTDTVCAPNRQSYFITVSTNGAVPNSTPTIQPILNGMGSYTFPNIPLGQSLVITARILSTGCQNTVAVSKFSCPCPPVNAPASSGDKEYCSTDAIPILNVVVGSGETVNWYDMPTGGLPLQSGLGVTSFAPPGPGLYFAQTQNTLSNCISATRTPVRLTQYVPPSVNAGSDVLICAGQPIILKGAISDALGGQWTANPPLGAFDPNNSFLTAQRYLPPGNQAQVVLKLSSNDPPGPCPAKSDDMTITINPLPTLKVDSTFCAPDLKTYTSLFSAQGTPRLNAGLLVLLGNGKYAATNIPKDSTLNIQILDIATSCSNQARVTAPACPCSIVVAPISGGDVLICEGDILPPLTALPTGTGQRIDWYDKATGGLLLARNTSTFLPNQGGTYYAEAVQIVNDCPSGNRTPVTLNILPRPTANAGPNQTICLGDTATLLSQTPNVRYLWSTGATDQSIQVVPTQNNVYGLTVTSTAGCSSTASVSVNLFPPIVPQIDSIRGIACFGQSTGELRLRASGGTAPYSLKWSNGKTVPQINNLPAGIYSATVTDQTQCQATIVFVLGQPPALLVDSAHTQASLPSLGTGAIQVYNSGGTPPYTFVWSQDGGPVIAGATGSRIDAVVPGSYRVTITDRNNCSVVSGVIVVRVVGAKEVPWASEVKLYPNPTNAEVYVEMPLSLLHKAHVQVWNVYGQYLETVDNGQHLNGLSVLSLEPYPPGVYFIAISIGQTQKTWRIVRQ